MDLYLRPETAQGIFVNFLNVQKTSRMKIPSGCSNREGFRNEIVARQFIFRMREFEQMEMQFFVPQDHKSGTSSGKLPLKMAFIAGYGRGKLSFYDHEKDGALCRCGCRYRI